MSCCLIVCLLWVISFKRILCNKGDFILLYDINFMVYLLICKVIVNKVCSGVIIVFSNLICLLIFFFLLGYW